MATIRQKKTGYWFLEYRDVDGLRYRVSTGTQDEKKAKIWLNKVEELMPLARLGIIPKVGRVDADVIAGRKKETPEKKDALTLKQFKAKYEDRARHDLEHSQGTIDLNNLAINSFLKAAGNKFLDEITDEDVISWKRRLTNRGIAKATQALYHRQLRAAFNRAIKWGFLQKNSFASVEVAKVPRPEHTKDMSLEEVQRLLRAVDEAGDFEFANYLRFMLYLGARRNEVLFLKWEDIDLEEMTVRLYAQKTKRTLVLPINKALQRVVGEMEIGEEGYIFRTKSNSRGARKKGKPWHPDSVSHWFKKYIIELELPSHYSLHSLRHTYATHLRSQGVPLDIIQKLLGHSSPITTEKHYDHSIALSFRKFADLLDVDGDISEE
jgi:integrase